MHYNVSVPEQALNWEEFMYMYSVHVDWRLVVEAEPLCNMLLSISKFTEC